ncbi:MAG: polysaccharide biosynthesis protein, partial [Candidatus Saccharibacteria bacterium]|nr:polysaccharide biosynthesis protein [Rhodoferax sp.]
MNERVMAWPRLGKQLAVMVMDVALALFAMWVAFTLRLDTPHWPAGAQWYVYLLVPALVLPIFIRFGLYRAIFRYTGLAALMTITQAVALYGAVLFAILLGQRWPGVPRTIGLLQPIIFLLLVGGSRALARFWLADIGGRRIASEGRLLIYGAGAAGVQTAAAIANAHQFVLVGFVDDDAAKSGRSINGVTVHRPDQIADLVERRGVTDILLALPSTSRGRRNEIIASLRSLPVHIRSLPGMSDLASGRVTVRDFNELDIEDLLG